VSGYRDDVDEVGRFDPVVDLCDECFTERAANGECMCGAMP